jgi:hypothetical protein
LIIGNHRALLNLRAVLLKCPVEEVIVGDFWSLLVLGAFIDEDVVQRVAIED